jgi:hypothetical protein
MWPTPTIVRTGARNPTHFVNRALAVAVVFAAITAGVLFCGAGPWAGGFLPYQLLDTTGQGYYQHSFTLIDLPSQALEAAIPELRGLVPAASQQQLPRILSEVGNRVEESYRQFTRVVADEHVTEERCGPRGRLKSISHREFSYMIISHLQAGEERIHEYRAGANGRPVEYSEAGGLAAEGFAGMWALLLPGNQSGSRFRYLGQQQLDGHRTNVIGFAQRPGWSAVVGFTNTGAQRVLTLEQGVVWIDKDTNNVMQIRADLLKPRLDVRLELQTTQMQFGEVHISDAAAAPLLLPLRVTVTTVLNGQVLREVHVYSNYQLPAATFKIESELEKATPPAKTH